MPAPTPAPAPAVEAPATGASSLDGVAFDARQPPRRTLWQRLTGVDDDVPEGWRRPGPGWRGLRTDVPIAVLLIGLMALNHQFNQSVGMADESPVYQSPPWAIVAMPAMFFVAIALRRRWPIPMLIVALAAFTIGQFAPYGEFFVTQVATFVSIYSASAWSRHRRAATVLNLIVLAGFVLMGIIGVLVGAWTASLTNDQVVLTFVFSFVVNVLYVAAAMLFGANDYRRTAHEAALLLRSAQLRERTAALEAERRVVAAQAVRLDRVEIARELHDVVAHHVSLMGLQAAAARRSLAAPDKPGAPEKAERALLAVEQSARTAITELQQLLTTLRSDEGESPPSRAGVRSGSDAGEPATVGTVPDAGADATSDGGATASARTASPARDAPSTRSIEQVSELVASVRDAGLAVTYQVVGEPHPVTRMVGFTAYRIVQEALTNAQKHAGPGAVVDVRVRYRAQELELDVTSRPRDGRTPAADTTGGGRGIAGMRERASVVGGRLEAGGRADGGYRVVAVLPASAASPLVAT